MMKRFRIRYYFCAMQEGYIEAESKEKAEEMAEQVIGEWDWETPQPEFVDSPFNDIEVTEV
jgi:hypothetical protein